MAYSSSRVLRQGCPLSPLLFLLAIKYLSQMVSEAKLKVNFTGIKISSSLKITHLIFVDDVIIFGVGNIDEWKSLHDIFNIFFSALGMDISMENIFSTSIGSLMNCYISLV